MKKYAEIFGVVSPTGSGMRRATNVITALAPPPNGQIQVFGSAGVSDGIKGMVPGVVGAVVGALYWKRHPVLGILAGHAIGSNAMELYKGDRTKALCNVAVEGAGVYAALKYGRGKTGRSVMAWAAGSLAAAAVTAVAMPSSPAAAAWKKLKAA